MVIKVKYNGEWVKIPYLSSDHGRELVEEAPKDGKQYARQNGVWSVVNIPEVDFTDVYKDFLQKRKQLKEQVDSDFVAYEQMQEELNSGQITAIT